MRIWRSIVLIFVALFLVSSPTSARFTRPNLHGVWHPQCLEAQAKSAKLESSVWEQHAFSQAGSATQPTPKVTAYTLPPEIYRKAQSLSRLAFCAQLLTPFYGLLVLWVLLRSGISARFRDWAERTSRFSLIQSAIYALLIVISGGILYLPAEVLRHWAGLHYGLSVQRWGSWLVDWSKSQVITVVIAGLLVWILYGMMRRSARRWWLWFWLVIMPMDVFATFIWPLAIDPLFHKFEPLVRKDPALVAEIEQVARRAGLDIPPERIFWMKASEKVNLLNAYVTGIGASKRIVVYDTLLAKETTPQVLATVGHEMGHYVLGHVWKGFFFFEGFFALFLYLGFRAIHRILARWGAGWKVRGVDDLASLPALLLLIFFFAFLANPILNGFSRYVEHQADLYGLEVIHGIVPDSQQVAAQDLQILGREDLEYPTPSALHVFLFYDHPRIADRIRFALDYNPWSKRQPTRFVH